MQYRCCEVIFFIYIFFWFLLQIITIATLVASTQAGFLGAPAISTHGLALGPALAAPAYATHAYAAPAIAAPAIFKAPIAAPALVKAAPSIDYVASIKSSKNYETMRATNYFSALHVKIIPVNVGRKRLSFLSKKDIGQIVLG